MDAAVLTQLEILKLSKQKPNFSELARFYGYDRRTIKKYYDGYKGKPSRHNKSSRLDAHRALIETKLKIRGSNIRAVYEFVISEIDPDIGTYSNFVKYVRLHGLKPAKTPKGHPRYETEPGIQAQVDWKEDVSIANRYGEQFTFQVFSYKLGYSRYPVFIYRLYKTRQDVFDCLIECFKKTGGVPKEILFDNMSSVVDRDGKRRKINERMKAFAKDFGFNIKLCKPRHAFTKGKVESVNKFIDWMKPYEGEFETEDELIDILRRINEKVWNRPCEETGVPPILLFQKEKEYLKPLPAQNIIESYLSHDRQTTVRKDSMITFRNCKYSVPAEYIGVPVRLNVVGDTLFIYFSTELIAQHRLSEKRLNYKSDHYRQLLSGCMHDEESIAEMADRNLRLMDTLL